MARAWFGNSVLSFNSEKRTIARDMTDVDVGSGALFGLDWTGSKIAMVRGTIAKRQRGVYLVPSQNESPGAFADVHFPSLLVQRLKTSCPLSG